MYYDFNEKSILPSENKAPNDFYESDRIRWTGKLKIQLQIHRKTRFKPINKSEIMIYFEYSINLISI